jgi:DNA (cytosine-5)-methyltransferase 1
VTLSFGSVCSGIEAASVAWDPLGWRAAWFAEIEPFPSSVLAHRFPAVPNLGDMTMIAPRIMAGEVAAPDVLVGGTPCQSFSVAGLRKGLADDRGNLALEFIRLADAIDAVRCAAGQPPAFILWENVPGVLSDTGNAFGTFLAGLVGSDAPLVPRGRWTDAGVVHGPSRCAAWRVLDAQFHGLAQRRERVFVLACGGAGTWAAADALLPVIEGLRWHPAPRREARKGVAGALATRPDRGGVNSEGSDGKLIPQLANTLGAKKDGGWRGDLDHDTYVAAYGGNNTSGPIDVAAALNACATASGRQDFESETFITEIAPTLTANGKAAGSATQQDAETGMLVAHTLTAARGSACANAADLETYIPATHTLRAAGFDGSEDGTGRGTPLVPVAVPLTAGGHPNSNAPGRRKEDDTNLVAHAFDARQFQVIQYGDMTGPLDTDGNNIGLLAFDTTQITSKANRSNPKPGDPCHPLAAGAHAPAVSTVEVADTLAVGANQTTGMATECVAYGMAVRRLTPRECERLQGFPDDHTLIPYRGKPAADGPRYRALGNSMAVPVMRGIGHGIARAASNLHRTQRDA